jgi:hypothetical protein
MRKATRMRRSRRVIYMASITMMLLTVQMLKQQQKHLGHAIRMKC